MKRTMAVLTKPDLAIETTIKQIAIDHVKGKRGELTLGYYIVKNRGPDDAGITLEEGQKQERAFFSAEPWSDLKRTGKTGTEALKAQVRALLADLVKSEFKKLRSEVEEELRTLSDKERAMGPPRSDSNSQRAYLGSLCDQFQSITRDALNGNYTQHVEFFSKESHRLITRIVELDEQFSAGIRAYGHTRAFTNKKNCGPIVLPKKKGKKVLVDEPGRLTSESNNPINPSIELSKVFPIVNELSASNDCNPLNSAFGAVENSFESDESIMEYIRKVYTNSRSAELGTASQHLPVPVLQIVDPKLTLLTWPVQWIATCNCIHGAVQKLASTNENVYLDCQPSG